MRKTLVSKKENGTIEVTIKLKKEGSLTGYESHEAINSLTEAVIKAMCETPYFKSYIHQVKIK